jgi:hypothetical protein
MRSRRRMREASNSQRAPDEGDQRFDLDLVLGVDNGQRPRLAIRSDPQGSNWLRRHKVAQSFRCPSALLSIER